MIDTKFWVGKRVYLTGHTGFKGSWLSLWLSSMGVIVKGYSLQPPTSPNLFSEAKISSLIDSEIGDIRDFSQLSKSMSEFNPDILIHMAAQPLVRFSYEDPVGTYETNVMGTVNVLEAARNCKNLKSIVNITTDKCYENNEWEWGYRENEPMGGYDPYSSSKACVELVTSAYRRSFMQSVEIGLATARAGNVIGGGDWAEDRLIPDILKAFEKNQPVVIRNPKATRPWQHVLEPLSGYLTLAHKLYEAPHLFDEAWNFGPSVQDVKPVNWIMRKMSSRWPGSNWILDDSAQPHEANDLKLDISKAKARLSWEPVWSLEYTLGLIVDWHSVWLDKGNMQKRCLQEIGTFSSDLHEKVINENK